MPDNGIDLNIRGGNVAHLVLNNSPLNLITADVTCALDHALDDLASHADVTTVVVSGAGARAFSAGSDVKEFPALRARGRVAQGKLDYENRVFSRLASLSQITIAAIRGMALGGGLELALCCDIRIAANDAQLGFPEVHLGVFPGSGGLFRLPRLIGEAAAKELMLFGDSITAKRAVAMGLVNETVAGQEVMRRADELAGRLAARPQGALQAIKTGVQSCRHGSEKDNMQLSVDMSERIFSTPDAGEGITAFLEKRRPNFNHTRSPGTDSR